MKSISLEIYGPEDINECYQGNNSLFLDYVLGSASISFQNRNRNWKRDLTIPTHQDRQIIIYNGTIDLASILLDYDEKNIVTSYLSSRMNDIMDKNKIGKETREDLVAKMGLQDNIANLFSREFIESIEVNKKEYVAKTNIEYGQKMHLLNEIDASRKFKHIRDYLNLLLIQPQALDKMEVVA